MIVPYAKHNTTVDGKDFYLSYNFRDIDIYGSDTTAIVIGQMQRFYILNGNHIEKLKNRTFKECIKYFLNNKHLINKRSDSFDKEDAEMIIREYKIFLENLTTI